MPELSHDEALKHVLHDEIVERLDTIIALLEQKDPEPQDNSLFWRVSKRLERARELIQRVARSLAARQQDQSTDNK